MYLYICVHHMRSMKSSCISILVYKAKRGGAAAAMAARRKVSVEEIILMQSMFAAKNLQGQRGRLLELRVQLLQTPGEYPIEEVAAGLAAVLFDGLKAADRYLAVCLKKAAEDGARLAPSPSFSDYRQLCVAAKRLPARPTTQTEAYARIQAALYAVKVLQEHLLPSCIDHLFKIPAAATVQAAGSMEEARTCLNRACATVNLAIDHNDLAIAAISRFVHPREVAGNSRFADRYTNFGWDMEDLEIKRMLRGFNEADPDLLEALKKLNIRFPQ